jgi:transposase-like protein
MTRHAERICRLAHESVEAGEADQALRALTELRTEVDAFVRVQVERSLRAGGSFSDVARALGISRQAAHRRFRELAPGRERDRSRRLVATDAARQVVRLARAEASAGAAPAGSEHVLLGVLGTDSEAMRALRREGLTAERIRAHVRSGSDRSDNGHAAGSLRRIVRRAARVAVSRGDEELDVQALLLAAVADEDGGARRALAVLPIEAPSIRGWLDTPPHR